MFKKISTDDPHVWKNPDISKKSGQMRTPAKNPDNPDVWQPATLIILVYHDYIYYSRKIGNCQISQ